MRLDSDFIDFYDHMMHGNFDTQQPVLHRRMDDGPIRREMFKMFDDAGIPTPAHGVVKDLMRDFPHERYVAYVDETLHVGEGKLLIDAEEAGIYYLMPMYASLFIKDSAGFSTRHLYIGHDEFVLRYSSIGEWRSNVGDRVKITLAPNEKPIPRMFNDPIYAIDVVGGFAVDYNVSPGLKGTPIEEIMTAQDVADAISEYYDWSNQKR